ncbi:unnamed protein product, partial [Mesorhabditis belari]|uniref:Uncharacterized protein n=1 Tax=Mesorhabditis belari TaxID=2138241 RepID=A0AAF3ELZ6_9BILA
MEETIFSLGDMSLVESTSSLNDPQTNGLHQKVKVYYYMDEKKTPYVVEIADSSGEVTLGDFLKVFSFATRGYKYFCKALDKDLGCEVKVELPDEHSKLQTSANGLYELFLLTLQANGSGTLPRHSGTLPRKGVTKDYMSLETQRVPMRRRRSLEAINSNLGTSVPSLSSRGTVLSRRAGEHLAELYTSNSEDPYQYDENSRERSSMYDTVVKPEERRKRKPRKERYRKAYVPSTISSMTGSRTSLTLPQILEVHLPLNENRFLGISVIPLNGGIIVTNVMRDSVVAQDGRIEAGDQIVSVNQQSLEHLSDQEAIALLRKVAADKKPLTLYIAKMSPSDSYTETLTTLTAADQTMPLDIPTWVTTAVQYTERYREGLLPDETQSEIDRTFGEGTLDPETDDEERRLYYERRNGAPLPRSLQEEAERRRENERNQQMLPCVPKDGLMPRLSVTMDPAVIIRAAARTDSGLVVKNRKWLKILMPQSFIGSDFVDWLLEHVEDIRDRKEAKKYATSLFERKYIKHIISKISFTEKCYYVFEEAYSGRVGSDCAPNTSGGTAKEATTEVTYISSPGLKGRLQGMSGFHPGKFHVRGIADMTPGIDMTQQTWPFSPITNYDNRPMNGRLRDCESPNTNDYASMVGESVFVVPQTSRGTLPTRAHPSGSSRVPPPANTPHCGSSLLAPPHPSPAETEFEDDDRRRILNSS